MFGLGATPETTRYSLKVCYMDMFKEILTLLWIVLPSYVANGTPVIGAKVLDKTGFKRHPVDGGALFIDGRRVFGDNKTWEGLAIGIMSGVLVGICQAFVEDSLVAIARGVVMSVGAMVGDLTGAFIKRRLGLKPGDPLPVLDQTLFLFAALGMAHVLNLVSLNMLQLGLLTLMTLLLHIITNYLAYLLNLKEVPW